MYSLWLLLETLSLSCMTTSIRHWMKQHVLQSMMSMAHTSERTLHVCIRELVSLHFLRDVSTAHSLRSGSPLLRYLLQTSWSLWGFPIISDSCSSGRILYCICWFIDWSVLSQSCLSSLCFMKTLPSIWRENVIFPSLLVLYRFYPICISF